MGPRCRAVFDLTRSCPLPSSPAGCVCVLFCFPPCSEVFKEVKTLHEVYSSTPMFGIKYTVEEKPASIAERKVERKMDDVEIVDDVR